MNAPIYKSLIITTGSLLLTSGLGWAQSQVVFDNTANLINTTPEFSFGREYGDELALAGTARTVTGFDFAYFGNFGNTPNVGYNIRFYANDGTDAFPGAPTALRPGSLLWDSGSQAMFNGVNSVSLEVPGVVVPGHFTWTVAFNGIDGTSGKQAALMLANPATVGALLPGNGALPDVLGSYDDFWKKDEPADANSWALYNFGFGANDLKGNFYAKVTATPEPGVWALGITGVALLWVSRPSRKNNSVTR